MVSGSVIITDFYARQFVIGGLFPGKKKNIRMAEAEIVI